ncbi:MAG: DNA primase [Holosporaceae bacterium]|jgi:DNA primase|nr:DNA primase [Holosporaceae bacterium]
MNKEFIDFLKTKASIVDVVSQRVRLRKSGRDWFGLCPFHKEKTGSLKVDSDRGFYYCFGCGAGGDVISFVQNFDKVSFSEAVEIIANSYGIPLPAKEKVFADPHKLTHDALGEIKTWFARQLDEPAGENARKYLESRKISRESIEKFQLGFAPNNQELFNHLRQQGFSDDVLLKTGTFHRSKYRAELTCRYNGRLIFPILNSVGKCVGFGGRILDQTDAAKYINSPETEIFVKSDQLYGYFLAKRSGAREIILVEGYLDVISMHQAGFDGAAAPLGTSIGETQINMCWNVCDNPVVSLDGDGAGIKASYRWTDKILSCIKAGRSFKFAKLPQGSDPDQLIANNQSDIIREAVKNAVPLSEWLWEGAFLLYPSETPEQKAAVVKTLMDKIDVIPDISVKKLYRQIIKQKERDLYRQKFPTQVKKENIRPIVSVRKKLEKIFVVTIINHPYIMDRIIESFVKLEFNDSKMQNLKSRLLNCYENYLNGDVEKYVAGIALLKSESAADIKDVELHAKFAAADVSDEEAAEGWFNLANKYSADHLIAADLQTAASSLKSTFSENDWQRLKALKHEIILGRAQKREI